MREKNEKLRDVVMDARISGLNSNFHGEAQIIPIEFAIIITPKLGRYRQIKVKKPKHQSSFI